MSMRSDGAITVFGNVDVDALNEAIENSEELKNTPFESVRFNEVYQTPDSEDLIDTTIEDEDVLTFCNLVKNHVVEGFVEVEISTIESQEGFKITSNGVYGIEYLQVCKNETAVLDYPTEKHTQEQLEAIASEAKAILEQAQKLLAA